MATENGIVSTERVENGKKVGKVCSGCGSSLKGQKKRWGSQCTSSKDALEPVPSGTNLISCIKHSQTFHCSKMIAKTEQFIQFFFEPVR